MAAGVPVVATAAGAVPEVVGDGAVLVEPGDVDALAGRSVRVLDGGRRSPTWWSEGGRQSGTFSWEACGRGPGRALRRCRRAAGGGDAGDVAGDRSPRSGAVSDLRLLMMVEQLRRAASGGIGTYVRGLLQGLDSLPTAERPDIELVASRPGRRPARPAGRARPPGAQLALPGPVLTRSGTTGSSGLRPASTWSMPPPCPPWSPGGRPWWPPCTISCGAGCPRPTPAGGAPGTRPPCGGPCAGPAGSSSRPTWWPTTWPMPAPRGRPSPSSPWAPTICLRPTSRRPLPGWLAWASVGPSS